METTLVVEEGCGSAGGGGGCDTASARIWNTSHHLRANLLGVPVRQLPACAAVSSRWAVAIREDGLLWSALFAQCFGGLVDPAEARGACRRCLSVLRYLGLRRLAMQQPKELSPRAGSAAGMLGPYVVITGGATTNYAYTSHLDAWDPRTQRVVAAAMRPEGEPLPSCWQHSSVSWNGELWLYGGKRRARLPVGCLHVLSLLPGGEKVAEGDMPRIACRSVVVYPDAAPGSTRLRDRKAMGEPATPPGHGHVACLLTGGPPAEMLCFGGERGSDMSNLLWAVTLPPSNQSTWRTVEASGAPPSPRFCHSAERLSHSWLIFGGWAKLSQWTVQFNEGGSKTVFNDLHVLTLSTMTWTAPQVRGSAPRGRCQASMLVARDEEVILVFGGACHSDPEPGQTYGEMVVDLDDVALLHVPTRTWLPSEGLPRLRGRRGGTGTSISMEDGRRFVFGGMNSDGGQEMPNFLNELTEVVGLDGPS